MTAWTCSESVDEAHRQQVRTMLSALGKELYVETENMIDMATSLSATGPTYIFMVMEAMTDAGVHLGFSREISKELVQQTMLGSVLFAMESHKHPPSSAIWSPRPAEHPPRRSIRWKRGP